MVGDVTVNKPGEAMRKMLANDRNVIALAEIIKNPAILDTACAPQIADAASRSVAIMARPPTRQNAKSSCQRMK